MHLHVRKNIPVASIPRLQKIKRVTLHGELGYQPSESFLLQLLIINCNYLHLVKTDLTSITPTTLAKVFCRVEKLELTTDDFDFMTTFQLEKILINIMKGSRLKSLHLDTLLNSVDVSRALLSEASLVLLELKVIGDQTSSISTLLLRLSEEVAANTVVHLKCLEIYDVSLLTFHPETLAVAVTSLQKVRLDNCSLRSEHVNEISKILLRNSSCSLLSLDISDNRYIVQESLNSDVPLGLNKLEELIADTVIFDYSFFYNMTQKTSLRKIGGGIESFNVEVDQATLTGGMNTLEEVTIDTMYDDELSKFSITNIKAFLNSLIIGPSNVKTLRLKGSLDFIEDFDCLLAKISNKISVRRFPF